MSCVQVQALWLFAKHVMVTWSTVKRLHECPLAGQFIFYWSIYFIQVSTKYFILMMVSAFIPCFPLLQSPIKRGGSSLEILPADEEDSNRSVSRLSTNGLNDEGSRQTQSAGSHSRLSFHDEQQGGQHEAAGNSKRGYGEMKRSSSADMDRMTPDSPRKQVYLLTVKRNFEQWVWVWFFRLRRRPLWGWKSSTSEQCPGDLGKICLEMKFVIVTSVFVLFLLLFAQYNVGLIFLTLLFTGMACQRTRS